MMDGGYDDGYSRCACFWGKELGSLVASLADFCASFANLAVLDLGCGEGKNAIHLARLGANVLAVDISAHALRNARNAWPDWHKVTWKQADIRSCQYLDAAFDIVILYGVLHCLPGADAIRDLVTNVKRSTITGGLHVLCTFNNRHHDLRAHSGFTPTLCDHAFFVELYRGWRILQATDTDLHETHPHNGIPHFHSMTRILAEKSANE